MSGFIAVQQKLKQAYAHLSLHPHHYQFYDFIIYKTLAETPHLIKHLANNTALNHFLGNNKTTLEFYKDTNSDAKALMFGVLIKACMAIKSNTPQELQYSKALERILFAAHELEAKYRCGWNFQAINSLSGQFINGYNSLVHLVNGILSAEISVTELILQANKECLLKPLSSLNAALADLSRFILWQAGEYYVQHYSQEEERVKIIRPSAQNMLELLKDQVSYSKLERALICDWLGINCYVIHIADEANVFLEKAGTLDLACPFTLVISNQQTSLLFDNTMRVKILNEIPSRIYFDDPEKRFENLQLTNLILKQKLDVLKTHYEKLCTESFKRIADQTWQVHYLTDLYNYFIKCLRPLVFQLTHVDNMIEWEIHLHELLQRMQNNIHLKEFMNYIGERLEVIYRGEFPLLHNESIPICLNVSFRSVQTIFTCSLKKLIVQPKEYQTLLILVQGIQRIHLDTQVEFEALKSQLNSLSCYLFYILSMKCIPHKFCNELKNKVAEFFDLELNVLEQNHVHSEVIQQEFIEVLNVIGFENPAEKLRRGDSINMEMPGSRSCTLFRPAFQRTVPIRHPYPSSHNTSMHHKNGT